MDNLCDSLSSLNLYDQSNDRDPLITPKCKQMCPTNEMLLREQTGLLHRLELINFDEWFNYRKQFKSKTNHGGQQNQNKYTNIQKAVKRYERPSAGKEALKADEIRPTFILKETVDYLIDKCLLGTNYNSPKERFANYYDFVFNRLRSVRQDMIIQRAFDSNCFYILERCIEFYINSHYVWLHFKNKDECKSFDAHLNQIHLEQCLNLLICYYDHFETIIWSKRRYTFEMLYLLYNLKPDSETLTLVRFGKLKLNQIYQPFMTGKAMIIAEQLIKSYLNRNFVRLLRQIYRMQNQFQLICCSFIIQNISYYHSEMFKSILKAYRSSNNKLALTILAQWFCPSDQNHNENEDYVQNIFNQFNNIDCDNLQNGEKYVIINNNSITQIQCEYKTIFTEKPINWLHYESLLSDFFKQFLQ